MIWDSGLATGLDPREMSQLNFSEMFSSRYCDTNESRRTNYSISRTISHVQKIFMKSPLRIQFIMNLSEVGRRIEFGLETRSGDCSVRLNPKQKLIQLN